jgi:RimJ/RimL family protein N-acetyltransferase
MPLPEAIRVSTERLLIIPVSEEHIGDLLAVNGDDQVTRFLPYKSWQSHADGLAWLARMRALAEAGSARQLVLALRETGRAIGTLLLFRHDEGSRRIEIGFALGRPYWRHGFMREALTAACGYAFSGLACRRLEAEADPENIASCRLLERIGFKLEGRLRQRWTAKGRSYDTNIYGLLAEDAHRWPRDAA